MQTCCVSRVVATSILATNTHSGRAVKREKQETRDGGKRAKKDCGAKGRSKGLFGGIYQVERQAEMRGFINSTSKWRWLESCPSPAEFQNVVKMLGNEQRKGGKKRTSSFESKHVNWASL